MDDNMCSNRGETSGNKAQGRPLGTGTKINNSA